MSIFAMNWALGQRLESPQAQILIYVIADSADATGKTTHCDPDYMADRARMSRPTLYRRLAELEDLGLLQRFKSYSEHGAQVYEIRLNLEAKIDVPIRKRRASDDDDDGSDDHAKMHDETPTKVSPERQPKSHSETLVCTAKVSPVRQPESHLGDSQEDPPISKESPLPPKMGGEVLDPGPEHFAEFWQAYLGHEVMPRGRALAVFTAMTVPEREHARAAALLLSEQLVKMKRKPKNAHTWLADRGWLEFPNAKLAPPPPQRHWIPAKEARAIGAAMRIADRGELRLVEGEGGRGIWRQAPLPADLLALAGVAADDPSSWSTFEIGTPQFAAWRDRLEAWLGGTVEGERIWLEPFDPNIHGRPAMDPAFKLRRSAKILRVPAPWPPRRDGSWPIDNSEVA